tara:strand:+ start:2880 stop:4373 length:1494 start_codon:yes stop_codon:yes gene_type:complete
MAPIEIRIDSRVRLRVAGLGEELAAELRDVFTHNNPQYHRIKSMGFYTKEKPFIKTWVDEVDSSGDAWVSVPRGGMGAVRELLRDSELKWKVLDLRTQGSASLAGKIPQHRIALWDHQRGAKVAAIAKENCLLRAPTGSGKTTAAIAIASALQLPTIVIVWSGTLFKQWAQRLVAELGIAPEDVGVVRGKVTKLRPVTIAMQQTLNKRSDKQWRELNDAFGVVICDEVQRFAAKTFMSTIDRFSARYRIGISADHTRKDRKEFLTYDMFGDVAHEVKRETLINKGIVHDVVVRVVPTEFEASWYVEQRVNPQETPDFNRLLDEMVGDDERNGLAAEQVIVDEARGETVIAMSHRREHCEELRRAVVPTCGDVGLMLGGKESEAELERSKAALTSGDMKCAVGTIQAIGTGTDIPAATRGVIVTPLANNKQLWGQVRGRFCRTTEGKSGAELIYLWDREVFGWSHLENLCKWNSQVFVWHNSWWVEAVQYMKEERHGR